jgi:hypothetical protein
LLAVMSVSMLSVSPRFSCVSAEIPATGVMSGRCMSGCWQLHTVGYFCMLTRIFKCRTRTCGLGRIIAK